MEQRANILSDLWNILRFQKNILEEDRKSDI